MRLLVHCCMIIALAGIMVGCGMNGTLIQPSRPPGGNCLFTIINNYDDDIVVKVFNVKDLNHAVHYIYVSGGNDATIKNVAPGNYVIRYSKGQDWDSEALMFKKNRENYETDQKFEFTETETSEETKQGKQIHYTYSHQSFTLGSRDGVGNVSTSKIDDKEFAK